jgi:cytochrome c oxidase cbb3-type subunit 4
MALQTGYLDAVRVLAILDNASSAMTVISFTTFLGILGWTFVLRKRSDFDTAAQLPFADEAGENDRG